MLAADDAERDPEWLHFNRPISLYLCDMKGYGHNTYRTLCHPGGHGGCRRGCGSVLVNWANVKRKSKLNRLKS